MNDLLQKLAREGDLSILKHPKVSDIYQDTSGLMELAKLRKAEILEHPEVHKHVYGGDSPLTVLAKLGVKEVLKHAYVNIAVKGVTYTALGCAAGNGHAWVLEHPQVFHHIGSSTPAHLLASTGCLAILNYPESYRISKMQKQEETPVESLCGNPRLKLADVETILNRIELKDNLILRNRCLTKLALKNGQHLISLDIPEIDVSNSEKQSPLEIISRRNYLIKELVPRIGENNPPYTFVKKNAEIPYDWFKKKYPWYKGSSDKLITLEVIMDVLSASNLERFLHE